MTAATAYDSMLGFALADKYRIVRELGRGGMGIVYEAEHMQLGKRVAIKVMLEKYTGDSEATTRFHREAVAASRIGNPHIIEVSDFGVGPGGRPFVVMELLNGAPLSTVLERSGPMPPWRAVHIMKQVLRAVAAAHAKGIVHRDLKPDNIFLLEQGDQHDFVKLLDFGISKVLDPDEQRALTRLTSTGVVMGTPLYMAPEQAMGQPIEKAADIYACGVILYELLAGRPPFEGQTYAVLVAKLLTQPPEYLANVRPGLPMSLVNAVHRALEKEPAARFISADQFAASLPGDRSASEIELAGTLDSGMAIARVTQRGPAKSRTWIAVVGALLLGMLFAIILIATQTGAGSKPEENAEAKPEAKPDVAKPEPKPAPAPAPKTGSLEIRTTPPGARVFIDGQPAHAVSPANIVWNIGPHRVRVELDGHVPIEADAEIEAGTRTLLVLPTFTVATKATKVLPIVIKDLQRPIKPVTPPTGPRVGPEKTTAKTGQAPSGSNAPIPKDPEVAPPVKVKTAPPPPVTVPGSKPNPYGPQ